MGGAAVGSTDFEVHGMTCTGCTDRVEQGLCSMRGVKSVEVSLEKGLARVLFDAAMVTPRLILKRIEEIGYEARMMG